MGLTIEHIELESILFLEITLGRKGVMGAMILAALMVHSQRQHIHPQPLAHLRSLLLSQALMVAQLGAGMGKMQLTLALAAALGHQ
jgi:hypothetical protein